MTKLISLDFLAGKKTYVVAVAGLVVTGLWMFGVVDDQTATQLLTLLGFGGAITLRKAVK